MMSGVKRLLLALFCAATLATGADTPAKFGALTPGTPVPDFKAVTPDNGELKLSDYKGKVVVVNLWTTNRAPAAVLENAHAQYQSLGVATVGICTNATREEFN